MKYQIIMANPPWLRKPIGAYRLIEQLYPKATKLDVFSIEKYDSWDQFGNQVDYFNKG